MQKKHFKKGFKGNKSTKNPSPRLLQILKKIISSEGGTVSYFFIANRIQFTGEKPLGENILVESVLSAPINTNCFYKEVRGKRYRRTLAELLELFEQTCSDMGASYFRIN